MSRGPRSGRRVVAGLRPLQDRIQVGGPVADRARQRLEAAGELDQQLTDVRVPRRQDVGQGHRRVEQLGQRLRRVLDQGPQLVDLAGCALERSGRAAGRWPAATPRRDWRSGPAGPGRRGGRHRSAGACARCGGGVRSPASARRGPRAGRCRPRPAPGGRPRCRPGRCSARCSTISTLSGSTCSMSLLRVIAIAPRVWGRSIAEAGMSSPSSRYGPFALRGRKSRYCSPTGERLRTLTSLSRGTFWSGLRRTVATTPCPSGPARSPCPRAHRGTSRGSPRRGRPSCPWTR